MWIVIGGKDDMITLVSHRETDGMLPVGSYLTVCDEKNVKHILLVEQSQQKSLFEPSPLVVDAGLPVLEQDQECKNIIRAREIRQFPLRSDGLFSFIRPNQTGRRTTQEEIAEIFPSTGGYPVFLATNFLKQNAPLRSDNGQMIYVQIPLDSLYLQTMICGQTGSGKTVAMKFLMEQFLQKERGAVLAINVKSIDLLTMNQPTTISKPALDRQAREEWNTLNLERPALGDFSIYIPSSHEVRREGVTRECIVPITLRTEDLEPNSLLGVLQNITDRAAESLPNIFRYWKERSSEAIQFRNFIQWFNARANSEHHYMYETLSQTGEEGMTSLHAGTCSAILRSLDSARDFFDSQEGNCLAIREDNIMVPGKLSVIDVSSKDTVIFGSVLLRHLLSRIYESKTVEAQYPDLPVLIVIDEVHQFYRSGASIHALEELNAIARMGRSERIGVIFASQNPQDLPQGLTSIVNTRIFFRTLEDVGRKFVTAGAVELSSLDNGFAVIQSVALPQIRLVKFPLPLMGVNT